MPFPIEMIIATKGIRAELGRSEIEEDLMRGDSSIRAVEDCRIALMDVNADPCFRSTVEFLAQITEEHRREYERILSDRDAFGRLLEEEASLLLLAGADYDLTEMLIDLTQNKYDRQQLRRLQIEELYRSLLKLQVEVASIRDKLQENKDLQKPNKRGWRQKIADAMIGLGGVAIIGLNASALAVTIGLGAPGSAVSAAIGSTLVRHSLQEFLSRPDDDTN